MESGTVSSVNSLSKFEMSPGQFCKIYIKQGKMYNDYMGSNAFDKEQYKRQKTKAFTTLGVNGGGVFFCSRSSQFIEKKKPCALISF